MQTYKGRFSPRNPSKYKGDPTKIVYRSLWERQVMRFFDEQPDIISWNSEEVVIPYRCKTDGRLHRYFVDFKVQFSDGKTFLIEIKPAKETVPPKRPKKQTRRYITEVMTYAKNYSKWEAAEQYALDRGWEFVVWTEDTLKKLGITIL
jgi:hypothetical protein